MSLQSRLADLITAIGADVKALTTQVVSVAVMSTTAPAGNRDSNQYYVTAQSAAGTIAAPTGTPANGNMLLMRIKDNGTARALTWNAIYRAVGVTIPTTTVVSKVLYVGAIYNSTDSLWDVIAVGQQ